MRRHLRRSLVATALTALLIATSFASPAAADAGQSVEDVFAKGVDAVIVRPLATIRVVIGAAMMVPAGLLSLPNGRAGIDGAYEVLIDEPIEYAFVRKLGEF